MDRWRGERWSVVARRLGRALLVALLCGGVAGVAGGLMLPPDAVAESAPRDANTEIQKDLRDLKKTKDELDQLNQKANKTPEDRERIRRLTERKQRIEDGLEQWANFIQAQIILVNPQTQGALDEYFIDKALEKARADLKAEEAKPNPNPKKIDDLKKNIADLEQRKTEAQRAQGAEPRRAEPEPPQPRPRTQSSAGGDGGASHPPSSTGGGAPSSFMGGGATSAIATGPVRPAPVNTSPAARLDQMEAKLNSLLEILAKLEVKLDRDTDGGSGPSMQINSDDPETLIKEANDLRKKAEELDKLAEAATQGGPAYWDQVADRETKAAARAEQDQRGAAKQAALERAEAARATAAELRRRNVPDKPGANVPAQQKQQIEKDRADAIKNIKDEAKEAREQRADRLRRAQAALKDM